MARLIVEEGGTRRAFKVGDGVLTVGTGAEARLRVAATDVAEIHAELQIQGKKALLRARPGVVPPTVGGEAVLGEAPVAYGEEIKVGSVRLWIEDDALPAGTSVPPPAAAPAPAATTATAAAAAPASGTDRAVRREQAIAQAKKRGDRSMVQRTQPRVKKGLPGGVIAILIVAVVVVGGFAAKAMIEGTANKTPPVQATLDAVADLIKLGSYGDARERLDNLREVTGADAQRRDSLKAELAGLQKQAEFDLHNMIGSRFYDTKLVKYEQFYLQGAPDKPKAREFLKRCREFKERWPQHSDRDWVERQEKRFQGFVNLSDPPTYADVEWQVECLTKTNPKYFGEAFEAIDAFIANASGFDLEAMQKLRGELVEARKVEYLDRIQQAKYLLEKKDNPTDSFAELVYIVTRFGDPEMTNEAATMLLKFDNLEGKLRGWRDTRGLEYEQLIEHPMVRQYIADHRLMQD